MKNIFVLDTNILLDDPNALFSFNKNDVVLPYKVIEELEKHKTSIGEIGLNARDSGRKIADVFAKSKTKNLKTGVQIPKLGKLKVVSDIDVPNHGIEIKSPDDHILAVAVGISKEWKNCKPILVTNDVLLRLRASSLGVEVQNYNTNIEISSKDDLYAGYKIIKVKDEIISKYWEEYQDDNNDGYFYYPINKLTKEKLYPNDFLLLVGEDESPEQQQQHQLVRVTEDHELKFVKERSKGKVRAINAEQTMAFDLLTDPSVDMVTLTGIAGTGKTLLALAAGLDLVLNKKKYRNIIILRPMHAVGKDIGYLPGPQPLDAKILTPTGWTTMGQLKIGDKVIARDGNPTKILDIFPKGKKKVYKLTTNNGNSTECCEDHLWLTKTWEEKKRNKEGSVKNTKDIIETIKIEKNKKIRLNHYLPRNKAVNFEKNIELPLSPYVLGVLLGDGSLSNSINISSCDKDAKEIMTRVNKEIKHLGCIARKTKGTIQYYISGDVKNNKPAKPVMITNINTGEVYKWDRIGNAAKDLKISPGTIYHRCKSSNVFNEMRYEFLPNEYRWSNKIKNICHKLGILHTSAKTKHIPSMYLYNSSIADRIHLLQGLMDTDGTIKKNGETSFTTISTKLAQDVKELVKSLGGNCSIRPRNRIGKKSKIGEQVVESKNISYDLQISMPNNINPFYLSRKAKRHKCSYIYDDKIESIDLVGEKEVQCILIDNPEHLYITDDFIVTHNTKSEKLEPWTAPIKDNLRYCLSDDNGRRSRNNEEALQMLIDRGIIEIEAMTYIRGRSMNECFIIVDEAQNTSLHEIKTILTRIGKKTKIVLTGDIEQTDRNDVDSISNGLSVAVEKFKKYKLAGHVSLKQGVRSPIAELAAKIL